MKLGKLLPVPKVAQFPIMETQPISKSPLKDSILLVIPRRPESHRNLCTLVLGQQIVRVRVDTGLHQLETIEVPEEGVVVLVLVSEQD